MGQIPNVKIGLIGGSGTWAMPMPESLAWEDVAVLERFDGFPTPYGRSGPAKLIAVEGHRLLRFAMHGWHSEGGRAVPPWICVKQVASVFAEAGVEWAIVEGSVGGIQAPDSSGEPLPPWSVTVTEDFIMHWAPPDITEPLTGREPYPRMKAPFCSRLRQALLEKASEEARFRVYDGGVHVCTPVGRLETAAEIRMMARWGAHVVGQTLGHEAPLMRKLGIHFASLDIVSNNAEGISDQWVPGGMRDFYEACARPVGRVVFGAVQQVLRQGGPQGCDCHAYSIDGLSDFPVEGA